MTECLQLTGNFVSTGAATTIPVRSGISTMTVYNLTTMAAAQTTPVLVQSYWQDFMPVGAGINYFKSNADNALSLTNYNTTTPQFTLVDSSLNAGGTVNTTISSISNDAIPLATNTDVNNLLPGQIVRLSSVVTGQQLGGIEFTVGYNTISATTFSLDYMPQIAATTNGNWQVIPYDPEFYPTARTITKITNATQAIVTFSVTHGYKVGQVIRMQVPTVYGMTEMDGIAATIVAINTATTGANANSVTLNVNSTAFSAFVFPVSSVNAFTAAEAIPMAENTAIAQSLGVDYLNDATLNTAYIGMILSGGAGAPAGVAGNQILWVTTYAYSNTGLSSYNNNTY